MTTGATTRGDIAVFDVSRPRALSHAALAAGLLLAAPLAAATTLLAPSTVQAASNGTISGVVTNSKTKERIGEALVILQCACLQGARETQTNANGLYAFRDLPPGTYTVQVLAGQADVSKVADLPGGAKFRANFTLNPDDEFTKIIRVKAQPVEQKTSVGRTISMEEFRNIPVGNSTSRDFTQVVESSATASRDSAGISLAGTTGAESKYTVEGASVTNPAFGTVGASIVQEFVEAVEVQESGYDAEFGGAAGGQVSARRVSGTNTLRGVARFTYTPRLAQPRFILATDNAVRATETPDFVMQGVVVASGPIIKDKLFWSAGISATGGRNSLIQTFHNRIDKDGSGGYEDCPYENGDFDCADGADYIATEQFADQTFKTGGVAAGYQFGLDWAINPRHRLRLTVGGSPNFVRRTYRRAASDPFNVTLTSDPLGGGALTANGVVNEHFGWDRFNQFNTSLGYLGRINDDKIEIDAFVGYSQFVNEIAWRVDNPELKNIPTTQETDTEGENLFEFLDRDGRLDLVPGVAEACNSSSLPGLACPVRLWLSGGVGLYGIDRNRRAEGAVALTHFFNAAGAHQVKYGVAFEHLARHSISQYSGSNAGDFYNNCAQMGLGGQADDEGGEWCYDQAANDYVISNSLRVDNHRYIRVDTDNPDLRFSQGYGRVRKEQGELRAIATPLGAGARVPQYNETLTTQNYGVFLQDKWAILSNLFLSAGVRWELQDMRSILGDRAILIWDNVAPRVGVVYDWTDEGRSRLFASYGWFYQPLPTTLNSRVFGGLVDVRRSYRNAQCQGQQVTIDGTTYSREQDGQPTEYCPDFAQATTQLTEGAVVPRLRGQYNQQFQVGYEQEVIEDLTLGVRWLHTDLGRAVEDISTNGGLNFIIANPGVEVAQEDISRQEARCSELDAELQMLDMDDPARSQTARELQRCLFLADSFTRINELFESPRRNFDAFTFEVKKRFARNWTVLGSYTFSRLIGNYDGFVDPITGAINLGASAQYDIPELVRNSFGPLANDTPHRIKLDGFYSFDLKEAGRLTLGTSFRFTSGYPISLKASNNLYGLGAVYVVPRGAGGRVEPNYFWNASLSYAYPLPGNLEIEAAARVINLTNARAIIRVDEIYSFQNTRAVAGGDLDDLKHTKIQNSSNPTEFFQRTVLAPQGNFGVESSFQTPLAASFELQLRF